MKSWYFAICLLSICHYGFANVDLDASKMQQLINTLQQKHHLPGIQIGIKDTNTGRLWSFSSGYSNTKTLVPLKNDDLMQIGSVTKSFIASLVLLLEADSERGSLGISFNIDQTLSNWLPQYPKWQHIKIRNLLNMTSGIPNYTDEKSLFSAILNDPKKIWQDHELINLVYSQTPNLSFPQGTKYSYSNTNYILVGMILEKITGLSLETLIHERIIKKYSFCFHHTSYSPKTYPNTEISSMAHGYSMDPKKHTEFYEQDITSKNLSWAGAAGAIISTASDLANWPGILFSSDFLPEKQRGELMSLICMDPNCQSGSPLPKDSRLLGYGLGVARLYDTGYGYTWTHTGGTLGYHSLFIYLPEKSLIISVIVNQIGPAIDGEDDVTFIAHQVFNQISC